MLNDGEEAGSRPIRQRETKTSLWPVDQFARQIAVRDLAQDQLAAARSDQHRIRQALGKTRQLCAEIRCPHLERVPHAHAVDLRQYRSWQVILAVGASHRAE